MREAQKIERFRLTFIPSLPALLGEPAELDPARLIWMEFQSKTSPVVPGGSPRSDLRPPDAGILLCTTLAISVVNVWRKK